MEDRTPYLGENDPPASTMFERLLKAAEAECRRQFEQQDLLQIGVGLRNGKLMIDGDLDLAAIIRAVLTELRALEGDVLDAAETALMDRLGAPDVGQDYADAARDVVRAVCDTIFKQR